MKKVLLPISNGFEEIEACTIIDILRRAELDVKIAALEELNTKGAHDIQILCDCLLDEVSSSDFDMIVLPGGLPNAFNLANSKKVQELLKEFKKEDKYLAAICAAPYALHKADVLSKNYTCYPSFEEKIRLDGYKNDEKVVFDTKVITSSGPATAMEFALKLVEILCGKEKYQELKEGLLYR